MSNSLDKNNTMHFSDSFTSFLLIKFLKGYSVKDSKNLIKYINFQDSSSGENEVSNRRENKALYLTLGNFDVLCINTVSYLYNNILPSKTNKMQDQVMTSCNYAGITFAYDKSILNYENLSYPFVAFTQIKLNSYYLFADSEKFLLDIYNQITTICQKYSSNIIINYSFSSYELSLCQFNDSIVRMEKVIKEIRNIDFDLNSRQYEYLKHFYNQMGEPIDNNSKRHFISDTLTHYGIKIVKTGTDKFDIINFKQCLETKEHKIAYFYLDMKVKPGHLPKLIEGLKRYPILSTFINDEHRFTSGRLDLELKEIPAKDYFDVLQELKVIKETDDETRKCIRDMQTKLAFTPGNNLGGGHFTSGEYSHINKLKLDSIEVKALLASIEENFSYDMYVKVSKMLTYYNNAISNPLTFNLYIEFYYFIKNFIVNFELGSIKSNLEILEAFDRAHYVRHFHESHSDEGTELLLGTNMPIQGLSSDINIIFTIIYQEIYNYMMKIYETNKSGPLTNYKNTIKNNTGNNEVMHQIVYINDIKPYASAISVNFNVPSVFNPEIFFNYLIKEASVLFFSTEKVIKRTLYNSIFEEFYNHYVNNLDNKLTFNKEYERTALKNMNPSYFIEDMMRYVILYDCDFYSFLDFHIINIIQIWKEYDTEVVYLNERLSSELFRWLFVWEVHCMTNKDAKEEGIRNLIERNLNKYHYSGEDKIKEKLDALTNWRIWENLCSDSTCIDIKNQILKLIQNRKYFTNKKNPHHLIFQVLQKHMKDSRKFVENGFILPNQKGGFTLKRSSKDLINYNQQTSMTMMQLSKIVYDYRKEFLINLN